LQHKCAPVIAKALPGNEEFSQGRPGKGSHIWKCADKSGVFQNDPVNLCLLEHDFRHEDSIWVWCAPPGKIAFVPPVMGEDLVLKKSDGLDGYFFIFHS